VTALAFVLLGLLCLLVGLIAGAFLGAFLALVGAAHMDADYLADLFDEVRP
jgi:hypothetical protein